MHKVTRSKIKAWTHLGLYYHLKARPPRCFYCESDAWGRMWYRLQTCMWQAEDVYQALMFSNGKIRKYVKYSEIRLITLTLVDLGSSLKRKYTQWR